MRKVFIHPLKEKCRACALPHEKTTKGLTNVRMAIRKFV